MSKILLIIPSYNEEENILKVYKEIEKHKDELDYVFINDGSTDNSVKIFKDNKLNYVDLVHNLGIGGAVQTGYKYALENGYDIAIQFDGDGQHDINYVKTICKPIIDGEADFVIGSRYLDDTTSGFKSTFMRRLGKNIISVMIKWFWKQKITDPTSGFRAGNKKIIKNFAKEYPSDYPEPESTVTLLKLGYKVVEKPVNMKEREAGESFANAWTSCLYMLKVSLAIIVDSIFRRNGGKK